MQDAHVAAFFVFMVAAALLLWPALFRLADQHPDAVTHRIPPPQDDTGFQIAAYGLVTGLLLYGALELLWSFAALGWTGRIWSGIGMPAFIVVGAMAAIAGMPRRGWAFLLGFSAVSYAVGGGLQWQSAGNFPDDPAWITSVLLGWAIGRSWRRQFAEPAPLKHPLVLCAVILALNGLCLNGSAGDPMIFWTRFKASERAICHCDATLARLGHKSDFAVRKASLPRIRSIVGPASIDMVSFEQGAVLLNRLIWHPRPVFQGYSAYTASLLEANARFFRGNDAPRYILFKLETIDGRFPTTDDNLALMEILQRYEPVLAEKDYLLLCRLPAAPPSLPAPLRVWHGAVHFNQSIPMNTRPGTWNLVSLDIREQPWSAVVRFLYKSPALYFRIERPKGIITNNRVVPSLVRSGFILDPLVTGTDDVLKLYGGSPGRHITSFRLQTASHPEAGDTSYLADLYYKNKISVTIWTMPGSPAHQCDPASIGRISAALEPQQ